MDNDTSAGLVIFLALFPLIFWVIIVFFKVVKGLIQGKDIVKILDNPGISLSWTFLLWYSTLGFLGLLVWLMSLMGK